MDIQITVNALKSATHLDDIDEAAALGINPNWWNAPNHPPTEQDVLDLVTPTTPLIVAQNDKAVSREFLKRLGRAMLAGKEIAADIERALQDGMSRNQVEERLLSLIDGDAEEAQDEHSQKKSKDDGFDVPAFLAELKEHVGNTPVAAAAVVVPPEEQLLERMAQRWGGGGNTFRDTLAKGHYIKVAKAMGKKWKDIAPAVEFKSEKGSNTQLAVGIYKLIVTHKLYKLRYWTGKDETLLSNALRGNKKAIAKYLKDHEDKWWTEGQEEPLTLKGVKEVDPAWLFPQK